MFCLTSNQHSKIQKYRSWFKKMETIFGLDFQTLWKNALTIMPWYAWSIWCIGIPGYNNCSWESDDTTLTEYICQNASKCVRKKSMMYKKENHITDLTFFTIMYLQGVWKSSKIVSFEFSRLKHTVRNLHFLSKNSTLKNSWKCCGFGLFSCWQLWFHEENCQKHFL